MAAPKHRSKAAREAHLAIVASLHNRGYPEHEIAQYLEVSQPQISYDLKVLEKRWQQEALDNIDERKRRMLRENDEVKCEAWREWDRSKLSKEAEGTKKVEGDKARDEEWKKSEGRLGDPRYLERIQAAHDREAKLLGLDAPKESRGTVDINANVRIDSRQLVVLLRERLDTADPEERAALIAGYEQVQAALSDLAPLLTSPSIIEGETA